MGVLALAQQAIDLLDANGIEVDSIHVHDGLVEVDPANPQDFVRLALNLGLTPYYIGGEMHLIVQEEIHLVWIPMHRGALHRTSVLQ